MGMRALSYRLHDTPDIDAIFDDGVADGHVLQRDLVTERNVLYAPQRDRAIFVEDEAGQRRAGGNAFDHYDGDGILGIVQHAMDQSRPP